MEHFLSESKATEAGDPDQSSISAIPDLTRREKAALQKIDISRSLALGSNRVFLIFSLTLLLCWAQSVAPRIISLRRVHVQRQKFLVQSGRPQSVNPSAAAPTGLILSKEAILLHNSIESEEAAEKTSSFLLPFGFSKIDVTVYSAPLLWCALSLSLLIYLSFSRRRCFAQLGRALRILKEEVQYSDHDLADVCSGLPWWFVPLPNRDGQVVTSGEFRNATGWIARQQWLYQCGGLVLFFAFTLQMGTCVLSFILAVKLASRDWTQFLLLCTATTIAILSLVWLKDWLRSIKVPDHLSVDQNPNSWGRRQALSAVGVGFMGALIVPPMNIFRSFYASPKNPRLRTRHQRRGLGEVLDASTSNSIHVGGLLNIRSRVIFYVAKSDTGDSLYVSGLNTNAITRNYKPVSFSQFVLQPDLFKKESLVYSPPRTLSEALYPHPSRNDKLQAGHSRKRKSADKEFHVEGRGFAWAVEQEVELLLQQNLSNTIKAADLLLTYLSPSPRRPMNHGTLRLFDRLAALTVKHNDQLQDYREKLIVLAEGVRDRAVLPQSSLTRPVKGLRFTDPKSKPETGLVGNMLHRAVFGSRPLSVAKSSEVRQRYHWRKDRKVLRNAPQAKQSESDRFVSALKDRISKWKDPKSKWFLKWSDDSKQWKLPPCIPIHRPHIGLTIP